ncbi:SLAP domain-containing protein, partial [Lactobacillus apis]
DKAEKDLTVKRTEPSLPWTNTTPSSIESTSQASADVTASDKNKDNAENKDTKEEGKSTKVMFKSVLYTKEIKKTSKTAKAYSLLNLVVEKDKLKVYTFNGQHFYKVVDKDEYVRVRNITGTKAKLKRNSYVYKSNGKKASRQLLKKGATVTIYGDQYKALEKFKKTYRIGEGKYVKSVNFYEVHLVK